MNKNFNATLKDELNLLFESEKDKYNKEECLQIDLHCHDHNSDKPDELLARILNIPETWLPSSELYSILKKNGSTAFTITNHNNARSCYELQDQGLDVLTGAEFTVTVPDFNTKIHVLAYGFSPEQEVKLLRYRTNLYRFQEYALNHDIPTTWAHPLFHYRKKSVPTMNLFEKLALVFQRFETVNGQRDTWQNLLVHHWINSLTPHKLQQSAKKYGLSTTSFLVDPYTKYQLAGSDSHMGIFSGQTGVQAHIPNLQKRLQTNTRAELSLEAIRNGSCSIFGNTHDSEKMTMAFLDYFCQIGLNMNDPGLMRILTHKGDYKDKILSIMITNGFLELKRHKLTTSFIKTFHNCFLGKKPASITKLVMPKAYKPVFTEAVNIAEVQKKPHKDQPLLYKKSVEKMYEHLTDLLITRLTEKVQSFSLSTSEADLSSLIEKVDIPSQLRTLFERNSENGKSVLSTPIQLVKGVSASSFKLNDFLDGLSFPVLASSVITAATFASAKVLYNTRPLLNTFSKEIKKFQHPKRMLWLSDTFEDKNGVAIVLNSFLDEIRRRDLPIDIMVCSSTLVSGEHLIVIPPKAEFTLPFYKHQPFRLPNILLMHQIVKDNEYDRIMCSTEGFMGLATIFLKQAYSIPAYFYIHTDWTTFGKKVLRLSHGAQGRVRRILRTFYHEFDHIFVLNSDQKKWLSSKSMNIAQNKVHQTAHWVDKCYSPQKFSKKLLFNIDEDKPVLLFTGRISEEKGAAELPAIFKMIAKQIPNIHLVLAGTGPVETKLKQVLPDATFLGWVDHEKLPEIYSAADLMILPSIFDTFGCVVLEALSCGTPVVSYDTKGPKDIIEHGKCGFLASNIKEMASHIIAYFQSPDQWKKFSKNAVKRASKYNSESIFDALLKKIDL